LQTFCFRDGSLSLVGGQEKLAFEQQGARDVEEINGPGTYLFRMSRRQLAGLVHRKVHVQDHLLQRIPFHPANQTRQGSVALVAYSRSLSKGEHSPLVKGSLANPVFHFQGVHGQVKEGRPS
jgi:hypothetical protein